MSLFSFTLTDPSLSLSLYFLFLCGSVYSCVGPRAYKHIHPRLTNKSTTFFFRTVYRNHATRWYPRRTNIGSALSHDRQGHCCCCCSRHTKPLLAAKAIAAATTAATRRNNRTSHGTPKTAITATHGYHCSSPAPRTRHPTTAATTIAQSTKEREACTFLNYSSLHGCCCGLGDCSVCHCQNTSKYYDQR